MPRDENDFMKTNGNFAVQCQETSLVCEKKINELCDVLQKDEISLPRESEWESASNTLGAKMRRTLDPVCAELLLRPRTVRHF